MIIHDCYKSSPLSKEFFPAIRVTDYMRGYLAALSDMQKGKNVEWISTHTLSKKAFQETLL